MSDRRPGRPLIEPQVAAALSAAVPARLIRKLDASPAVAETWTWRDEAPRHTVTTDKGEVVALVAREGAVRSADAVGCSCLLGPRCLHVLAVIARLAPTEAAAEAPEPEQDVAADGIAIDVEGAAAAAHIWRAGAALLAAGAEAAGVVRQAEVLRAIHSCRAAGVHRAAAAGTRVVRWLQELQGDRPEFALSGLTADLTDLLTSARVVSEAAERGLAAPAEWLGVARREYLPAGHLRLAGVFSEAVVARSGYAGVVTFLTDGAGRLFTRSDVAPGDVERALAAYDASAGLGDARLPHRELGRATLFVSDATASRDGRLGAGAAVRAVRGEAPAAWPDPAIARLWQPALADQLARMSAAEELPPDHRPAGFDLAFFEGTILGWSADALLCELGAVADQPPMVLRLVAASESPRLRYRDNLAALATLAGTRLRAVGRILTRQPRTLALLAVGGGALVLPGALAGRANLAWDLVTPTAAPPPIPPGGHGPAPDPDPLAALRRRVERATVGGAGSLPPEAAAEIAREAAWLDARHLRGGAEVLRDLAAAATAGGRNLSGMRRLADPDPFARAWLRAARYQDAAQRALIRASWL